MPEIKTDEAEKNGAAASAEAPGTKDVKKNKKQKEDFAAGTGTCKQRAEKIFQNVRKHIFRQHFHVLQLSLRRGGGGAGSGARPPFSVHVRADFYLQHRGSHRAGNPRESKNR